MRNAVAFMKHQVDLMQHLCDIACISLERTPIFPSPISKTGIFSSICFAWCFGFLQVGFFGFLR